MDGGGYIRLSKYPKTKQQRTSLKQTTQSRCCYSIDSFHDRKVLISRYHHNRQPGIGSITGAQLPARLPATLLVPNLKLTTSLTARQLRGSSKHQPRMQAIQRPSTPAAQTSRSSTPASQRPSPAPQPGSWTHPRFDEIARRQNAATFTDRNVRRIIYNAGSWIAVWAAWRYIPE